MSIRYRERASIRYRALRIFRKRGGYKVQPKFFPSSWLFFVKNTLRLFDQIEYHLSSGRKAFLRNRWTEWPNSWGILQKNYSFGLRLRTIFIFRNKFWFFFNLETDHTNRKCTLVYITRSYVRKKIIPYHCASNDICFFFEFRNIFSDRYRKIFARN